MATWGNTTGTRLGGRNAFNRFFYFGGTSPAGASNVLTAIYLHITSAQSDRISLYSGGTSGDPSGASLLEDLDVTAHSGTGYEPFTAAGTTTLPDASLIWIAQKNNGFSSASYETGGLPQDDITTAVSLAGDQANGAWPSSAPSTTYTSEPYGFMAYLEYTTGGGGGTILLPFRMRLGG